MNRRVRALCACDVCVRCVRVRSMSRQDGRREYLIGLVDPMKLRYELREHNYHHDGGAHGQCFERISRHGCLLDDELVLGAVEQTLGDGGLGLCMCAQVWELRNHFVRKEYHFLGGQFILFLEKVQLQLELFFNDAVLQGVACGVLEVDATKEVVRQSFLVDICVVGCVYNIQDAR
jgi:hypothetical protein